MYLLNFSIACPPSRNRNLRKGHISQSKFFINGVQQDLGLHGLTYCKGFNWSNHISQSNNLIRIRIRKGQNVNLWEQENKCLKLDFFSSLYGLPKRMDL